ncbi:MAG: DnaJ domain-containing protein [Candidatus Tectimicrobiota bacterium]
MAHRMEKDYYAILGVGPEATEAEIKRAYHRKALEHHPDRNPGDPAAEERFKEATEAYGVLIDPVKRRQYDAWRTAGFDPRRTGGFDYRPEDIFRDVFRGPHAAIFHELMREFSRQGLRFDRPFVHRVFFPGMHGVFFGGVFVGAFNPFSLLRLLFPRPTTERPRVDEASSRGGLLDSLRRALTGQKDIQPVAAPRADAPEACGEDLLYHLAITPEEARDGAEKTILVRTNGRDERVQVKIPPGVRTGQKLRLRGKGHDGPPGARRGDCYIALTVTE